MGLPNFKNLSLGKLGDSLTRQLAGVSAARATQGPPIGVDFGVGSLKILQVTGGNPPALVAAACLETPIDLWADHKRRLDFQLEALPRLIRHSGFKGKRAVCAIPSWQVFCKHLSFPRQDGVDVDDLVNAAVPVQLQCDPNAVVSRHVVVPCEKSGGRIDTVVMATAREVVDRLMRGLMACKLEPVGMHPEFVAAMRGFDSIQRREGDLALNSLYLDIGATSTNVMISHGSSLAFARVIDIGGYHLDIAIDKQLKCGLEEARRMRLGVGATMAKPAPVHAKEAAAAPVSGDSSVATAEERRVGATPAGFSGEVLNQPVVTFGPENCDLSEPIEILTDEVQRCLRYHASHFTGKRVERAVFIGGEARQLGLCQRIARSLKLPAQMADPLARVARTGGEPAVGVNLTQPQPGWSVPLGLCLSPTDL